MACAPTAGREEGTGAVASGPGAEERDATFFTADWERVAGRTGTGLILIFKVGTEAEVQRGFLGLGRKIEQDEADFAARVGLCFVRLDLEGEGLGVLSSWSSSLSSGVASTKA